MTEDRRQRTDWREAVLWRGGSTVVGTASLRRRTGATDRVVCHLSSVVCSLDIVKRVVTVKQVQPFRLAGPGHGYAIAEARASAERRLNALVPGRGSRGSEGRDRGGSAVSGLFSDLCPLSSGLACLGLGVGELW
jgi:hypothetical protein